MLFGGYWSNGHARKCNGENTEWEDNRTEDSSMGLQSGKEKKEEESSLTMIEIFKQEM